ncbi:MAG: hypothetical protein M3548_10000 [Actinomycetota bacterium]|nr:hypothetical protein [Actinomycetota bacterium]
MGLALGRCERSTLRAGAAGVLGFLPGESGLAVVSLSGLASHYDGIEVVWGPTDVVASWVSPT